MADLIYTNTNSGDDSAGRAFGLEGNLYLPVVIAAVAMAGLLAILVWGLHLPFPAAAAIAGLPFGGVFAWVVLLRHGKPAGHDRDWWQHRMGDWHFTRSAGDQEGLL